MNTCCSWPFGANPNQSLNFHIYDRNDGWLSKPGLYIFTFLDTNGMWTPLYVGQTDDFSVRFPRHEKLGEAVQLGATHIHALHVPLQADRNRLEFALISYLQPTINVQLKSA